MFRKILIFVTSIVIFLISYFVGLLISSEHVDDQVIVAVLDTGVDYTHVKLRDNMLTGFDFIGFDRDPMDDHGHGTHIAGLVEKEAPAAKILPVRMLNTDGVAYGLSFLAVPYAIINGADVINMSYSETPNPLTRLFIYIGHKKGVIFVGATGNDASNEEIVYPAKYKQVISVSAIDERTAELYSNANISNDTNVLAPGVHLKSTGLNNNEIYKSGTSMSTAIVSGLIAKKLQTQPHMSKDDMLAYLNENKDRLSDKDYTVVIPEKIQSLEDNDLYFKMENLHRIANKRNIFINIDALNYKEISVYNNQILIKEISTQVDLIDLNLEDGVHSLVMQVKGESEMRTIEKMLIIDTKKPNIRAMNIYTHNNEYAFSFRVDDLTTKSVMLNGKEIACSSGCRERKVDNYYEYIGSLQKENTLYITDYAGHETVFTFLTEEYLENNRVIVGNFRID
ncbi:S8 family peptidase [Radiobacillus sp. PE A8.2]|uniref:S8 family peptidase n=1 Tax=Radiobacillus sp. PE A8.2 TaxID=3380349 RepID=UPI00388E2EF1